MTTPERSALQALVAQLGKHAGCRTNGPSCVSMWPNKIESWCDGCLIAALLAAVREEEDLAAITFAQHRDELDRAHDTLDRFGIPKAEHGVMLTVTGRIIKLAAIREEAPPDDVKGQTLANTRAYRLLASAMRKMLPPPLLAEVVAHLDPLDAFVTFLQSSDSSVIAGTRLEGAPGKLAPAEADPLRATSEHIDGADGVCLASDVSKTIGALSASKPSTPTLPEAHAGAGVPPSPDSRYEELRAVVLTNVAPEKRAGWQHQAVLFLAAAHVQDSEYMDKLEDAKAGVPPSPPQEFRIVDAIDIVDMHRRNYPAGSETDQAMRSLMLTLRDLDGLMERKRAGVPAREERHAETPSQAEAEMSRVPAGASHEDCLPRGRLGEHVLPCVPEPDVRPRPDETAHQQSEVAREERHE